MSGKKVDPADTSDTPCAVIGFQNRWLKDDDKANRLLAGCRNLSWPLNVD